MATSDKNDTAIICRHIWKIFGPHPERIKEMLKAKKSRSDIMAETGHVVAVKDVTFEVRRGNTFVVMGLSGSGKSTLVRCMTRLIEPTGGQVIIDGEDVTKMSEAQLRRMRRQKMSMVFQHFGLFPHRTVLDNAAYGLEIQGVSKEERHARAKEVLDLVSLAGWEQHYPDELSGGMQQRVGIARALTVDPNILFFDEPFSALDPLIRREMQDELLNLQKIMQKTIVFITHDFLEAVKLADTIAIMKDGGVVQIGTPDQIIINPINDYVREFTKDVPRSRVLSARSIMRECEVVCTETEQPAAVQSRLERKNCAVAYVTAKGGRYLGQVTAGQLAETAAGRQNSLGALINDRRPTVSPQTFLSDLISVVAEQDGPVAVVDQQQRLVGQVDRAAVILALSGSTAPAGARANG